MYRGRYILVVATYLYCAPFVAVAWPLRYFILLYNNREGLVTCAAREAVAGGSAEALTFWRPRFPVDRSCSKERTFARAPRAPRGLGQVARQFGLPTSPKPAMECMNMYQVSAR